MYYLANNLDAEMEADQEEEEKFWYSILENLDTHPTFFTLLVRLLYRIDIIILVVTNANFILILLK